MGAAPGELMRILTRDQPLGPPYTEELLRSPRGIFEQLYDRTNGCHGSAERDDPVYGVGRKGSGKPAFLDRKSTRLNSSHANISYAVFCLKKQPTNSQAFIAFVPIRSSS